MEKKQRVFLKKDQNMVEKTSETVMASLPLSLSPLGYLTWPRQNPESLICVMSPTPHHSSVILRLCQKGDSPQSWLPKRSEFGRFDGVTRNLHSMIHNPATARNRSFFFRLLLQMYVMSQSSAGLSRMCSEDCRVDCRTQRMFSHGHPSA